MTLTGDTRGWVYAHRKGIKNAYLCICITICTVLLILQATGTVPLAP